MDNVYRDPSDRKIVIYGVNFWGLSGVKRGSNVPQAVTNVGISRGRNLRVRSGVGRGKYYQ